MVESSIGSHLVNSALTNHFKVYYWRHRNEELDFVLEKRGKVIGLEVKTNSTKNTSGMNAFSKMYQPDKVLIIGNGGVPWQEFLRLDPNQLF